jgi:hypothetical protein
MINNWIKASPALLIVFILLIAQVIDVWTGTNFIFFLYMKRAKLEKEKKKLMVLIMRTILSI